MDRRSFSKKKKKKIHGNMIFLCKCKNVTNIILPFYQKKANLPRKNTLKSDISGITKKDDIHPRKYGISVEIPY